MEEDSEYNITKKIEKMAEFQMKKATHTHFLENCIAEGVVPNGLRLKLQVQVGNNHRLQEGVDKILEKTSMEITRLVAEENYHQLQESKSKMKELEEKLKHTVHDEGKLNIISQDIFGKTENKKNLMIEKQNKKLEKLKDARDCFVIEDINKQTLNKNDITKQKTQRTGNTKKANLVTAKTAPTNSAGKPANNIYIRKAPTTTNRPKNDSQGDREPVQKEDKKASKNENPHGSRRNPTYAEAVTKGEKKPFNKKQHPDLLTKTLMQLTKVLQEIQQTGDSSEYSTKESGNNTRKSSNRFRGVRRR